LYIIKGLFSSSASDLVHEYYHKSPYYIPIHQKAFIRDFSVKRIANPLPEDLVQLQEIRTKRMKSTQKNEEKIAIAEQTLDVLESFVRKLDNDLTAFEGILRSSGDFETTGAPTGQEVAVKTDLFAQEWILASVVGYSLDTGYYEVADADESKRYHLPESQVVVLNLAVSHKKLSKGEAILAGMVGGGGRVGRSEMLALLVMSWI
jgi:hypothetical protein